MNGMKKIGLLVLCFMFMGSVAIGSQDCTNEIQLQTTCPVMGGKINKDLYADYQGKRVYFCCSACIEKFKENPDKYVSKLEESGVTLEKACKPQTTCPVSGEKINKKYYADVDGFRVYTCGPGCVEKVKADPKKYLKAMFDKGERPELRLVVCPKCGELKGSKNCCNPEVPKCEACGMNKGSIGCCKHLEPAKGEKDIVLCPKCGEVKGSEKCCLADAPRCDKCGLIKDSPGCCHLSSQLCPFANKCKVNCDNPCCSGAAKTEGCSAKPQGCPGSITPSCGASKAQGSCSSM